MRSFLVLLPLIIAMFPVPAASQETPAPVEATTANGDRVLLHPNGRWEYVDVQKAAAARRTAEQYPENQGCPPGTQGGLLGIGRCVKPGDRDFNRGTLNPAKR